MSTSVLAILSPHADDAAFSLAETVRRLAAGGAGVRVRNCCTRTEHAPYRAPGDDRPAPVIRAAEDRAAARRLGISEVRDLGYLDAPLRLRVGVDAVCNPALPVDDALVAALAADLAHNLGEHGSLLLAPLAGPGAHVDHRVAHAAARRASARATIDPAVPRLVAWYEDLPYAARTGDGASVDAAQALGRALDTPLAPVAITPTDGGQRKRAVVACYVSQLGPGDVDTLDVDGTRRGFAERIWVPTAALALWQWVLGATG